MSNDKRNVLEVLKFELQFLEQGGYGRSVRTPWQGTTIFQDSPSCLNFNDPERPNPCSECLLTDFIPADSQGDEIPCHHIPLGPTGETVQSLSQPRRTQAEKEEAVKEWLRSTIRSIEQQRTQAPSSTPKSA